MKIQFFPTYFQGNNWETGCGWKSSGQHWHSNDQRNHWQFGGQIQQDPGKYTLGAVLLYVFIERLLIKIVVIHWKKFYIGIDTSFSVEFFLACHSSI